MRVLCYCVTVLLCYSVAKYDTVYCHLNTKYAFKGKGKFHPATGHEGPEGRYRSTSALSLTSALDGGEWLTPRPGRFTPGQETWYPLYRRLGGPQGRCGRVRKI